MLKLTLQEQQSQKKNLRHAKSQGTLTELIPFFPCSVCFFFPAWAVQHSSERNELYWNSTDAIDIDQPMGMEQEFNPTLSSSNVPPNSYPVNARHHNG